jgi:hypothetical protein
MHSGFLVTLVSLLMTATSFASPADQGAGISTCGITGDYTVGLSGDPATDIEAVRSYQNTVARMLTDETFAKLDCLADHLRSKKERFPGGMWKLHILYEGLHSPVPYPQHATERDWKTLLSHLQNWVSAYPKSATARVALASAYTDYAWDARGNGYTDTISENGQKLYEQRIGKAERILEDAATLPTKCPEWYYAMLRVVESEGSRGDLGPIFDRALKFEPGYYYNARIVSTYLLPRWKGQAGDAEEFLQRLSDNIGGDEGDIVYFQVSTSLIRGCSCDDDPHLSWPRIKKGFAASEKRYGVSMLNLNLIAFLASNYGEGDVVFAHEVLNRIGEQWDRKTWKTEDSFRSAKSWAASNAPKVAQMNDMEGTAEANAQTPEGAQYKAAFEKVYKELVHQCLRGEVGIHDKFETLTRIGANGIVEDMKIYWNGATAVCLYEKLHTLQLDKAAAFPSPPRASYWIRLDLDMAEFSPVAAK